MMPLEDTVLNTKASESSLALVFGKSELFLNVNKEFPEIRISIKNGKENFSAAFSPLMLQYNPEEYLKETEIFLKRKIGLLEKELAMQQEITNVEINNEMDIKRLTRYLSDEGISIYKSSLRAVQRISSILRFKSPRESFKVKWKNDNSRILSCNYFIEALVSGHEFLEHASTLYPSNSREISTVIDLTGDAKSNYYLLSSAIRNHASSLERTFKFLYEDDIYRS